MAATPPPPTVVNVDQPAAGELNRLPGAGIAPSSVAPTMIHVEPQLSTLATKKQGWLHSAAVRLATRSDESSDAVSGDGTGSQAGAAALQTARPLPSGAVSLDNSLVNVSVQADALARHAFGLAERGALYSARSEFIQALRVVAQGLDTTRGVNEHSRALASGLRALKEADDFMPRGARLEADLDLERLIATHRTPVLQSHDVSQLTPVAALQHYYSFGREELATAGGAQPAASLALLGLGKLYALMDTRAGEDMQMGRPKAMAMLQAAISIDQSNFMAANELGGAAGALRSMGASPQGLAAECHHAPVA